MGLEKQIESKVCEYAQEKGFLTLKLNIIGQRGWPDRVFVDPLGWHFYIEFKAPGKKLEKIQEHRFRQLAERNVLVVVIDGITSGRELIDELVAARVSVESDKETAEPGKLRLVPGSGTGED